MASDLRTGGPALGYGSIWNDTWAEDFFDYCRVSQAPLDFFSFHVYSEYPFTRYEERLTTIMPPDFYRSTIERIRGKLHAAQLPVMPELHVTEWNFSLYDRNYIHDTMFMAPFILRHALQSQGKRNFEYYSEDPCLTGELGAAFVDGLQSQGVAASVKHFACNNQEYEKMITSSWVDERTLREIYLSAFERIVKKADPWTFGGRESTGRSRSNPPKNGMNWPVVRPPRAWFC
ncbi:GH39 family glycosyl hydrolase [Paenibacillus dendritiformis]|uniref:GH39 family glycosyl hydrolase n=1 Tax=Paenibacillus dendritiformis TaxID=130049 RepID=UPI003B978FC2